MFNKVIYMKLVGKNNSKATQEIHIFLAPLNPDEEVLKVYYDAVEEWNIKYKQFINWSWIV